MTVKLLTEHHLEFLSLKGGCTGSSESTLVTMPHCWKSHVMAHLMMHMEIQCNLSITQCFGSNRMDHILREPCYKGTIFLKELKENNHFMVIFL